MKLTDTLRKLSAADLVLTLPDANGGERVTLRRQLFQSHLRLAILYAVSLLVAVFGIHSLIGPVQDTDERHVPMAQAAMTAQIGLHRANAALHGWVALKDSEFRTARLWAWENEIRPALQTMEGLTLRYGSEPAIRHMSELRQELSRLEKLQNWVDDVADKPGNEPARMVLIQELMPLSATMENQLMAIVDGLARVPASDVVNISAMLGDLRLSVARADGALGRYVVEGLDREEALYRAEIARQAELLSRLAAERIPELEPSRVEAVSATLTTYRDLAESIISSRRSSGVSVAWSIIEDRLQPLEARVASRLEAIAAQEVTFVTGIVSQISAWVSKFNLVSAVMLVLMSALAIYLSGVAARKISYPIYSLSKGVERMGRGHFHVPLREQGVAEVRNLIASFNRMQKSIETSHRKLKDLALQDELTGLPNRKAYNDKLQDMAAEPAGVQDMVGIISVDLDYFKEVNDTHGHDVGDEYLRQAAARIEGSIRDCDLAARVGGDEFVVVLGDVAGIDDAERIAARIRKNVAQPITLNGERMQPSCTMGIAVEPLKNVDITALQKHADLALYRAKKARRGTYQFHDEPTLTNTHFDLAISRGAEPA